MTGEDPQRIDWRCGGCGGPRRFVRVGMTEALASCPCGDTTVRRVVRESAPPVEAVGCLREEAAA